MIDCEIFIHGTSEHISQLFTGFIMLEAEKKIKLKFNFKPFSYNNDKLLSSVPPYNLQGLFVIVNGYKKVFYDVTDGENFINQALEVADLYFKRSYLASAIPDDCKEKVFPLGLNYEVYPGSLNKHEFLRFFISKKNYRSSPKELIKWGLRNTSVKYNPTVKNMYSVPKTGQKPKVLFMARTWDPNTAPAGFSDEDKRKWIGIRESINDTRATVIRTLQKELGNDFFGGFSISDYSVKHYPDCLLDNNKISKKGSYIALLREYPICIATTGLYNSIGWKLGEYVAFSKAIVSEKLIYAVPGNFEAGKNYLEFATAEECVKQTVTLFENVKMSEEMMCNNNQYYKEYLSPDKLILRTLERAK